MMLTGKNLSAYELPVWYGDYYGKLQQIFGEESWIFCLCHYPCIYLWKCVKPGVDNFNKQTTHKPVI